MTQPTANRYQARVDELLSLQRELETPTRPGDRGPVVGRVLEAAGDLLRRSQATPASVDDIDRTLALVPEAGLSSWAEDVSLEDVSARLMRSAEEAVHAAIPDDDDDGGTWSGWAMEGLLARDRLESALVALERLARARPDARAVSQKLRGGLLALDGKAKAGARAFTPLNVERRAEAALLDERGRAWWFEAFADEKHDALVKRLGGEGGVLSPAEASASDVVETRRSRSFGFDELLRIDLGLAPADRAVLERKAQRETEARRILTAMEEGEAAIAELEGAPDSMVPSADPRRGAGQASAGRAEVIDERSDFTVLAFRRRERLEVVVQPRRGARIAAAAVLGLNQSFDGQPSPLGTSIDLGPEQRWVGVVAQVRVTVGDRRPVTLEARF